MNKDFFKTFFSKHRVETAIFFVSVVIHLVVSVFLYTKFGDNVLKFENADAGSYIGLAESIVRGDGFSRDGIVSAVRTPAYPLFLAFLYLLPIPFTWAVLLFQNVIASLAAVLVFRMGRMMFSSRVGIIAGTMYALEPYMLMTANLATTETFFNFIIVVFGYYFIRWYVCAKYENYENKKILSLNLYISAVLLGVAALVRPAALYAPGVVMILLFIRWLYNKEKLINVLKRAVIFCTLFFLVLSPWMIRQYKHFQTTKITNIDSVMLYFRAAPFVVAEKEGIGYTDAIQLLWQRLQEKFPGSTQGDEYYDFRFYEYMVFTAKTHLASRPKLVFQTYAVSSIPALFGTGYEYMLTDVFGLERQYERVSYSEIILKQGFGHLLEQFSKPDVFQIVLFFSLGIWSIFYLFVINLLIRPIVWRKHLLAIFFLLGFASYFILVTLGPAVHARYRMPTFPWLFLLVALGIDFLVNKCILARRKN